jgi:hypothetical protein
MGARKYPFLVDIARYIIYTSFTILIINTIITKDVTNISFTWILLVFLHKLLCFCTVFLIDFMDIYFFQGLLLVDWFICYI